MKILKKELKKEIEIINVNRKFLKGLLKNCHDAVPFYDNLYIIADYRETFEDSNYNCRLRSPYQASTFCFGTFYVVKKCLFGFVGLSEKEITEISSVVDEKFPEEWWN